MSKTDPKKKHHPPAAPKPAQKPAEPADTPLNWAHPFTPVGKADATDPMTYFKALAKSENGFYPLGASGMWHGGVHFSHGSAEMLNQDSGVRAIADGKIVAYRLNTKYEETTYPDKTLAHYSTGFVLVRHELKLPPKPAPNQPSQPASAPAPASGTATPPTPTPPDSTPANSKPASDKPLVFFSLYMHTMDWETYRKAIEQAKSNSRPDPLLPVPMSYWEGERYYRVGDKAKDKQSLPKPKAPAQPAGTSNDPFGNPALPDYHLDDLPSVDPEPGLPPPPPETGLNIRDLPKGKVIGVLPKGAEVIAGEGDPAHPNWIKIKTVKSGTILPAVVGQPVSPQAPWGYLFKAELDAVVDPKPLDSVVILKEPHPVKAGEVIAHVGQYQWATKAGPLPPQANYPMLHLEVFAGPDLKDFIDRSRNRAKELNDKDKPLLEIMPGAKLVSEIPAPDQQLTQAGLKLVPIGDAKGARWVKVQPKSVTTQPAKGHKKGTQTLTDVGKPLWVESRLANTVSTGNVSGWQNFPLDGAKATGPGADFRDVYRRADLDKLGAENIAIDDKGRHWWNITIGSKDGSARQGWVCETGNPLVQFRSPWEWPGFVLVDNGSVSPADMYKRFLHATEQYLADEEGTEFMGTAAKVNAGELITTLEKAIDTNNDGKVTAQELKHALETRWMAEAISHLVVRNETEWGGGLSKWEELTPLMKKQTERWKTELDRLAKLQWWEQIKGVDGFPADLSPWHLHPIGLIGNFMESGGAATTISDDGIYFIFMQEHLEGVTNRLHWPGGASGVTLGAGYDMKARTAESVVADMKAIGLDDATATAISGGAGLEKDAARDFCKKNRDVVNLSNDKQVELLHKTVPAYVRMVNKAVKVQLKQTEFDALVSYAYNPGGGWAKVTDMINRGQIPEAMAQISQYVYSGGKVFDGLVKRRKDEVTLYTTGRYEFHGQSIQSQK
ncbi:chitinase class I family protein [Burkholderia multivorans]|uniref:Lysozyme n=1 Tax=Burkholderia multivorans TaxID=87883 RepID=A0ABD7LEJ8_9BURK|nr:glycoside hydrolase family protein [Burkholderia multivorans]SAK01466.1 chitinase class I family protein [Burkholderia multivorans]SAK02991.1 chitinase class I family protein [Burkholderia multivorans]HEF5155864.1 glycoside hydrolase family protein [Burkholderia multivorans]